MPNASIQALPAILIGEEPGGESYRYLVGVIEAVVARKPGVSKQLVVAKSELGGIEIRLPVLFVVLAVEVEHTGLKGLGHGLSAQRGLALKDESPVQAKHC